MQTFQKQMQSHDDNSERAMEAGNHLKNLTKTKNQMSRGDFLKTLGLGLVANSVVFSGCNKDDDEGGSNNGLKAGEIEIKAYPDNNRDNKIIFSATAKKITIDWGDGTVNEFNPNGKGMEFSHQYQFADYKTVSIMTELITDYEHKTYSEQLELRFGKCTELRKLDCSNKGVSVLDIKNAVASLETLECEWSKISSLDVSGASKLTTLSCNGGMYGNITELKLSGCTALKDLNCSFNQLTQLDLSSCTVLTNLDCWNNQLTQLDLSKNPVLTYLDCKGGELTLLDVTGCTALTYLNCDRNQLTLLDMSSCTALTKMLCENNKLTELKLRGCTALMELRCNNNQLNQLDVTGCTALTYLECTSNQLNQLDVSKNTALTSLNCNSNQLTQLDVSKNTALTVLECKNNQLSASALNALFESLPNATDVSWISFWGNPGSDSCDQSIYERKGWLRSI